MQIQTLRSIIMLCEKGSMSRCSEDLNISQQGLSSQIRSAEHELGVTLFERTYKGVHPTAECELLLPSFQTIINEYDEGMKLLEYHQNTMRSTLNIWICPCIREIYGLEFFMSFQETHPNVRLNLKFQSDVDCERALHEGKADAAFLDWPVHEDKYNKHLVVRSPMVAVMRKDHPFADKENMSVLELSGQNIIIPDDNHRMHQRFKESLPELYNSVNIVLMSDYTENFYTLPRIFGGIAIPVLAVCRDIGNDLVIVPFNEDIYLELSYCVMKNKKPSHALDLFSAYVMENMKVIC